MNHFGPTPVGGEPHEAAHNPRGRSFFGVVVLLAMVGPPAVEGAMVVASRWAEYAGRSYTPKTPVLDALAEGFKAGIRWLDFEAGRSFSTGLRSTWAFWPVIAGWLILGCWLLKKTAR